MREALDAVAPAGLRPLLIDVFRVLQRGNVMEPYAYWNNCYLLVLDGTQYFTSDAIHCPSCQEKHSSGGHITDSHAAVGAVVVHPDGREVIPCLWPGSFRPLLKFTAYDGSY